MAGVSLGVDLCPPAPAAVGAVGGSRFVRKESADQAVPGTSPVDALGLAFAALEPGVYSYRGAIFWTTTNASVGIKYAMAFTGGVLAARYFGRYSAPAATAGTGEAAIANAVALIATRGIVAPAVNWLELTGLLVATSPGDLKFQFASEVNASPITVKPSSFMVLERRS